ncbi:unnamed protein product [Dracunculus medinensis]|uniref:Secreted protein n=1 Tax=Dracunculus medinensis TaxID=318479 RepID=A0A0N4U955_DRAME|nr:unnamed protein product [Dracunculus medinensis]
MTKVMQALGMLHHLTKTKSNVARRASSASCKLRNCKIETLKKTRENSCHNGKNSVECER